MVWCYLQQDYISYSFSLSCISFISFLIFKIHCSFSLYIFCLPFLFLSFSFQSPLILLYVTLMPSFLCFFSLSPHDFNTFLSFLSNFSFILLSPYITLKYSNLLSLIAIVLIYFTLSDFVEFNVLIYFILFSLIHTFIHSLIYLCFVIKFQKMFSTHVHLATSMHSFVFNILFPQLWSTMIFIFREF